MLILRTFSEYRHSFFAQKKGENYGMKKTDEVVLNEMIENRDYIKDFE